ncbi:MAG: hypothetical protein IT365_02740 [Candidatus Hydrogenedentes bacterium]|nr:hypothetical protein [Candidatus Hydrogenedentota bacterium]
MRIQIATRNIAITGELFDMPTARKVLEALPCVSEVSVWGEEAYFSIPVRATLEGSATDVVEPGTICFWVQGNSLALPYGPTPVSVGNECRLVTAVNVLGRIDGDPRQLALLAQGDEVTVSRLDEDTLSISPRT